VAGSNAFDLEVLACVASELKHLSGEVLEDSCSVDSRRGTDTAVGAHSALEESVDPSHRELRSMSAKVNAAYLKSSAG